jgi:RimJ/RimL family protein N-acetyltransferase
MNTLRAGTQQLEPLLASHAAEMFTVLSDPAIYEFENAPPQSISWLHDRYAKLESRASPDGSEKWLNWVVRMPSGALAGYIQATVLVGGRAYVAYELASRFWRQGIGSACLHAVLGELATHYSVRDAFAVLKAANYRSRALLKKLEFMEVVPPARAPWPAEPDEVAYRKTLVSGANAA